MTDRASKVQTIRTDRDCLAQALALAGPGHGILLAIKTDRACLAQALALAGPGHGILLAIKTDRACLAQALSADDKI